MLCDEAPVGHANLSQGTESRFSFRLVVERFAILEIICRVLAEGLAFTMSHYKVANGGRNDRLWCVDGYRT